MLQTLSAEGHPVDREALGVSGTESLHDEAFEAIRGLCAGFAECSTTVRIGYKSAYRDR